MKVTDVIRVLVENLRQRAVEWWRRAEPEHVPLAAIRRCWWDPD